MKGLSCGFIALCFRKVCRAPPALPGLPQALRVVCSEAQETRDAGNCFMQCVRPGEGKTEQKTWPWK